MINSCINAFFFHLITLWFVTLAKIEWGKILHQLMQIKINDILNEWSALDTKEKQNMPFNFFKNKKTPKTPPFYKTKPRSRLERELHLCHQTCQIVSSTARANLGKEVRMFCITWAVLTARPADEHSRAISCLKEGLKLPSGHGDKHQRTLAPSHQKSCTNRSINVQLPSSPA